MAEERAVVFIDVDGTLVPIGDGTGDYGRTYALSNVPTPRVADAIRRLDAAGHMAVVCSARPWCTMHESVRELPFAGFITLSGGWVSWRGEVVHEHLFDKDELREMLRQTLAAGAHVGLEGPNTRVMVAADGTNPLWGVHQIASADAPILEEEGFGQVIGLVDELDLLKGCPAFAPYELRDPGGLNWNINPLGNSKGAAVRMILDELVGEGPRRVFGIGDSGGDTSMLELVDVPIAMGNASEDVLAMAAYVTDDVDHDGVASALEHFGLI